MPAVSKKQARFLGFIAGGGKPKKGGEGLTQAKAKEMLRGTKVKELPSMAELFGVDEVEVYQHQAHLVDDDELDPLDNGQRKVPMVFGQGQSGAIGKRA